MPSLIPGYEYDIFISYRHNDNLDGWVTDFLQNLEKELRSTLKDTVSIYFDKNPYDGLLETHNVDKSLEGKLKCLILIPIISQTYCDTKSFAWQQEFCAFNKLANEDQFGRDIKLSSGNVTSRILPVKIHDLDESDKKVLGNELRGVLRAIDFIFKSPGVNRPLTSNDKRDENSNKTFYRDQINKVANSIKEIIVVMKSGQRTSGPQTRINQQAPSKSIKRVLAIISSSIIVLAVVGYFLYPKLISFGQSTDLDKSIAILPFEDMSPNHDQEYLGDGIADEIINVLVQTNDLKVIARTSSFLFKEKKEDLRVVGERLGVSAILQGSVKKSGNNLRISAQLIRVSDGSHLWAKTFDRSLHDIFDVQDEIAAAVVQALKVTLSSDLPSSFTHRNEEAYKLYQQGRYFYDRSGADDLDRANDYFQRSLNIDSSQAIVWLYKGFHSDSKYSKAKAYQLDPTLPEVHAQKAFDFMREFKTKLAITEMTAALSTGKSNAFVLRNVGMRQAEIGKFNEAIGSLKKAIDLDPLQTRGYEFLGQAYIYNQQYDSAIMTFLKIFEITKAYQWNFNSLAYAYLMAENIKAAQKENNIEQVGGIKLYNSCLIEFALGHQSKSDSALNLFTSKYGDRAAFAIATLHAYRKEKDDALQWLARAFEVKAVGMYRLSTEAMLYPYHSDPRFIELVHKMNSLNNL